ncbi:hypothetical protein WMY93_008824 [Mugilogobius chulae]|uniref:Uncharacterized protein n=1 Tax=Mugilogobius chulae TaxID=88201 RepID=A0AAW0PL05_9GOBI
MAWRERERGDTSPLFQLRDGISFGERGDLQQFSEEWERTKVISRVNKQRRKCPISLHPDHYTVPSSPHSPNEGSSHALPLKGLQCLTSATAGPQAHVDSVCGSVGVTLGSCGEGHDR